MHITPVRAWDSNSTTGDLMELWHQLNASYEQEHNQKSGVTREQFIQKREMLIWGVQRSKVTFTLYSDGWLDARFCQENLDEVGGDEQS